VPGGGISPDGRSWVSCRPGFFLPVRVLSRLFRRLFLGHLAALHEAGRLSFFDNDAHLAAALAALLAASRKMEWVVAKRPFGGPLAYLSRYTHRVAIAKQPPDRPRPARCHLEMEGLSRRRPRPAKADDAREFIRRFLIQCCQKAFTASAITACWHGASAPTMSHVRADCSPSANVRMNRPRPSSTAASHLSMLRRPHDRHRGF
jgi:hypothetical protein